MRYVPWFTLAVALLLAITPMGQQIIRSSIHNGEQLAQSIDRLVLLVASAIMAGVALVEIAVRAWLTHRKRVKILQGSDGQVDRNQ